ncbi:lutropin-choriogonadotropic hormone receptor-like [Cochliomyia hominivorax]
MYPDLTSCHNGKQKQKCCIYTKRANSPNSLESRPVETYWTLVERELKTTKKVLCASLSLNEDDIIILTDDPGASCPVGYFHCNTTLQCVQQRLNCDGSVDCDDASDEWNCVNDADDKFWDHLFRKQPYGRNDEIPIGTCYWPVHNLSCPCRGNEILCRNQQLTTIPTNLPQHDVAMLDLTGNNFTHLSETFLENLSMTEELVLKLCSIITMDSHAFRKLSTVSVKTLYLNRNYIKQLNVGMFPTLNNLHTLSLADNRIRSIERNSFTFPRLKYLFLAGNLLTKLNNQTFCNLSQLQGLHLNNNSLSDFDLNAFDCLGNLTSLLLNDNEFRTLDPRVLSNLKRLEYIYFSWFHLCRAAMHVRVCDPHGDGISSTYHLLDNTILRWSVWIMASIAVIGNLLVILSRYFYKTRSNVEHSMYLRHLAASDFLMGVYLAIIACADIQYRGEYIVHEELWRHSSLCALSGFLSTFSCQSSTLLLTLITWDRLMSVLRPLHAKDAGRKRIIARLLVLWSISFALAAAPLSPSQYFGSHFYGTNGVCLSLHIHDPYAKGWEYSAVLFICINTFSLVFILISYIKMLKAIKVSGGGIRSTINGRESVVATRFAIIITTDCACWLPVIIVKLLALAGISISPSLYAWLAVLVLPVNSALNPILYTLTTAVFKQQLSRYCQSISSCSHFFADKQQTQFDSAVSTSLVHFGSCKSNRSNSGRNRSQKSWQHCKSVKFANHL